MLSVYWSMFSEVVSREVDLLEETKQTHNICMLMQEISQSQLL